MRRIIAVLAAVGISITGLVAVPAQASLPANGTYNCTTDSLNTGTFTITNGVVLSGGPNNGGGNCRGHANIPNGVTEIGQGAFAQGALTSVTLPNSVTVINDLAFYQSQLPFFTIPNSVVTIGDGAFRHMPFLTTITIPASVQTIGSLGFATSPLTSINFAAPSSLTTIGNYAFQSSAFTSLTIPATVTSLGLGAFQLNTNLTNINFEGTIPAGWPWDSPPFVTMSAPGGISGTYQCGTGNFTVANNAITGTSSCTGAVVIPNGVTSIADFSFTNSAGITSLSIPASVSSIGEGLLWMTGSLTGITVDPASTHFKSVDGVLFNKAETRVIKYPQSKIGTSYVIPSGVTSIAGFAFCDVSRLTSIDVPNSVTSIGQGAFARTQITSINIPVGVTSIQEYTFEDVPLTSITLPQGVTEIKFQAFYGSGLVSVVLPSSLTSIAANAFRNTLSLETVTFQGATPPSGTDGTTFQNIKAGARALVSPSTMASNAFGSTWNGLTVADGAANGSYACTTGVLSSSNSIPRYTIANAQVSGGASCVGAVVIPNGVTAIAAAAFMNSNITAVSLPPSLTSIGENAFRESQLGSVVVPGSLTQMGECAFCITPNLASVVIQPGSLTNLGQYTFASTPLLNSVTLPNNILVIGAGVFRNAIGFQSTYTSQLTSITLPSNLTTIGFNAFEGQNALTNLTIPASVSDIASLAFIGASSLLDVTFEGLVAPTAPADAFFNVRTGAKAIVQTNATGFGENGSPWKGLVIERPITVGTYACSTGLASNATPNFTITNGVVSQGQSCSGAVVIPTLATAIGANAFSNGTLITSIAIPATVTTINSTAFTGASALVTIVVNAGNADYSSVGGVLFNKAGTTLIKYPAGKTATSYTVGTLITEIAAGAFAGSSTLAGVNFEGNAPATVGVDAFSGLAAGAKALVDPSATGFGNMGSTWNALTVASNVIAPPASSSPFQQPPIRPLPRVAGIQVRPGNSTQSSTVKLQLTGVEQGQSGQDIQIKIFDVKGNLFKVLTVPINGIAGSLEVALPMALGEFTVEANTIGAAGAATELVKASSPIIRRSFHASPSSSRSPVLFGEAFARPITFAANSSVLTVRERKALLLVAAELRKTRSSLAITGFSARSGASSSFDRNLSNSRALSVARFLKAQGLSNILYVAGYGSINDSRSADSTRKVELRIIN